MYRHKENISPKSMYRHKVEYIVNIDIYKTYRKYRNILEGKIRRKVMVKELYKDIYSFEVVLPNSPLKYINIYVIKGKKRSLVLDTGYNHKISKDSITEGLKEIGLEISDVDLFITHLHSDHSGLSAYFEDNGSKVYASEIDSVSINEMAGDEYWNRMIDWTSAYGMKEDEIKITDNPGFSYRLDHTVNFHTLKPKDIIEIGEYKLEVVDLKGHTPGHIGLYEEKNKILFCGDTVLEKITPNITYWGENNGDMLTTYIDTLEKLKKMDINHCFSTHRKQVKDYKKRIDEIINHHHMRLDEITAAIGEGEKCSVRDITSKISWRIRANSFDEFPPAQKFFASGETMAHLYKLVNENKLKKETVNGVYLFSKTTK